MKSHSILMLINRQSQQFQVICRFNKFHVICFLKIRHVAFVCIEDIGLPRGLCILNICICM